jgi:hypothetical protein
VDKKFVDKKIVVIRGDKDAEEAILEVIVRLKRRE